MTHSKEAERDPLLGKNIGGKYRVMALIGKGGMGSVYEAVHTATEKRVALKVLAEHLAVDTKVVTRFRREALASSKLLHENCVQVLDFGEDPLASFFITMEFVNGHGLDVESTQVGPMSVSRVARIGVQLASALDSAHASGIVHRDLKPANIMITQKAGRPDFVKVVDFGIAKFIHNSADDQQALTVPGTIFGTPEYMSPEQARGDSLDGRSDLYSAAVVLWHLLLGRSPFQGETIRDTLLNVFQEAPVSPSAELGIDAQAFEAVLLTALAKNKEERPVDATAFLKLIEPFVGREGAALVSKNKLPLQGIADDGSAPETLPAESDAAQNLLAKNTSSSESLAYIVASSTPTHPHGEKVAEPLLSLSIVSSHGAQKQSSVQNDAEKSEEEPQASSMRVVVLPSQEKADAVDIEGRKWVWLSVSAAAFLLVLFSGVLLLQELADFDFGGAKEPVGAVNVAATLVDAGAVKPERKIDEKWLRLLQKPEGFKPSRKRLNRALRRGERAIDNENYKKAQHFFEKAILADFESAAAHRGYGLSSFHLGELELAKAHLEYLFNLDDDNMAAQAATFLSIIDKKLERSAPKATSAAP